MMKRIISVVLALALAAALLPPAAAAAAEAEGVSPWVQVSGGMAASQTVSIRGVSGSRNAVQITLILDQAPAGFQFDGALSGQGVYATYSTAGNSVTLYVTSKQNLNQGDAIPLGTLTAGRGFTVTSAAGLKLLDLDPGGTTEASFGAVAVVEGSSTSAVPAEPMSFTDVKKGNWFYDAVAYVYEHGMMNGTGDGKFSPSLTTNRGMIVTILHRYEGSPAAGASSFPDVAAGKYYSEGVAWAASCGVVNGYSDGRFAPDDTITREQMAAILYRYAQYKGFDVSGRADLSAYRDGSRISPYARDAMAWAVKAGLISGVGNNTLIPGGSATRAEVATILMRFCRNVAGDP